MVRPSDRDAIATDEVKRLVVGFGMLNLRWMTTDPGPAASVFGGNAVKKRMRLGLLAVVGLFGCNQETPIEKTKAAAASGNAATQAAGQAAVDAIKTPLDKARQVESTLEKSVEQTAAKIKEYTQ